MNFNIIKKHKKKLQSILLNLAKYNKANIKKKIIQAFSHNKTI